MITVPAFHFALFQDARRLLVTTFGRLLLLRPRSRLAEDERLLPDLKIDAKMVTQAPPFVKALADVFLRIEIRGLIFHPDPVQPRWR